jgi:hypothetical protein
MARWLLRARGSRRPVLALPLPGAAGKGMAGGALLPAADGPRGLQTFDEWVAETAGTAARAAGQGAAAHR